MRMILEVAFGVILGGSVLFLLGLVIQSLGENDSETRAFGILLFGGAALLILGLMVAAWTHLVGDSFLP